MSKTFRSWDVDQAWLLPPSLHDFVPAGHPAHLVRDMVRGIDQVSHEWGFLCTVHNLTKLAAAQAA